MATVNLQNAKQVDGETKEVSTWKSHWQLLLALAILFLILTIEYGFKFKPPFPIDLIIYGAAYLLAG